MRLLLAALLLLAACGNNAAQLPTDIITIDRASGAPMRLKVEIADEESERAHGLMERDYMPEDRGMLFVFDDVAVRSFWMHNTFIPLDMLFINADGRIVHIHRNAAPRDETAVSSRFPTKWVLELNAGMSLRWKLKEGDTVTLHKQLDKESGIN